MTAPRRYWDSDCLIGWINDELDKVEACKPVIEAAEAGELIIVTSALTLTEVIKLKGHPSIPASSEETIRSFFENPFLVIRNVDRQVAEYARHLIWTQPALKPKDSIHLATALLSKVPFLDTFDKDLRALDGRLGDPPLRIAPPHMERQGELFAASKGAGREEPDSEPD